jgi:hypothetical protein
MANGRILHMADSGEIPPRLTQALRAAIWGALPFIFFLVGVERIFDPHGSIYEVLGCFALAILSILLVVYWNQLLPRRWRQVTDPPLDYLSYEDSELGGAIRDMAWFSAWGKWFASQTLVTNRRPMDEGTVMQTAAGQVLDALMDGRLEARGRRPGQLDYEPIPQTHWRSTAFHMAKDSRSIWKMVLIPRGGAEIHPDGRVVGRDQDAIQRTDQLATYDSIIINSRQFEKLWPRRDESTDAARKKVLKKAKKAGVDPAEIAKVSRD